jgi:hypothetical protein
VRKKEVVSVVLIREQHTNAIMTSTTSTSRTAALAAIKATEEAEALAHDVMSQKQQVCLWYPLHVTLIWLIDAVYHAADG